MLKKPRHAQVKFMTGIFPGFGLRLLRFRNAQRVIAVNNNLRRAGLARSVHSVEAVSPETRNIAKSLWRRTRFLQEAKVRKTKQLQGLAEHNPHRRTNEVNQ